MLGPGAPNPSGLPGFNADYGVRANPGGGNPNATQLRGWQNTVTYAATAADSVMLTPGYAGMEVIVVNLATVAVQVFGYMNTSPGDIVTDQIIPPGSTTPGIAGMSLPVGAMGRFVCLTGQGGFSNGITPAVWSAKVLT